MSSGQDHLLGFILSRQQANLHAPYSLIFQTAVAIKQVIPVYHTWNTQHNSSQIMYAVHPPSLPPSLQKKTVLAKYYDSCNRKYFPFIQGVPRVKVTTLGECSLC